jgi:hypothetical protein
MSSKRYRKRQPEPLLGPHRRLRNKRAAGHSSSYTAPGTAAGAGGRCWRRGADRLIAKGHKVFTPNMTGFGERAHLMSDKIALATHIDDVANKGSPDDLVKTAR